MNISTHVLQSYGLHALVSTNLFNFTQKSKFITMYATWTAPCMQSQKYEQLTSASRISTKGVNHEGVYMTFNDIRSVHDFVYDSSVSLQISFFGTAFLCKKESVPIDFFGMTVFYINKTTASISIEDLAKRTGKLAIALRDSPQPSVDDKKLCNDSRKTLLDFAYKQYSDRYKSNYITIIFIYIRGLFYCGEDGDDDFARDIYDFKDVRSK